MKERNPHALRGVVCAALGGVCWGFSGTCGQYLFSRFEVSSLWLTCVRLLAGGILLLLTIAASFAFGGSSFARDAVLCGIGVFLAAVGALLGAKEPKRKRRK